PGPYPSLWRLRRGLQKRTPIENPWPRRAPALPINPPPPIKPIVLPQTQAPIRCADWPPGNLPARTERSPSKIRRANASISPKLRSAVASVVIGAVTVTGIRRAVAVATSILDGVIDCAAVKRRAGFAVFTPPPIFSWGRP